MGLSNVCHFDYAGVEPSSGEEAAKWWRGQSIEKYRILTKSRQIAAARLIRLPPIRLLAVLALW